MHDKRNFALVVLFAAAAAWMLVAWFFMDPDRTVLLVSQRAGSLLLIMTTGAWLVYALKFEDKLPNHLKAVVGDVYFEAGGVSFMPTVRIRDDQAELCVYYQNRYESPASTVIHLRPINDSFLINDRWNDVHFAFRADGGEFGVIHQPITVPAHLRGEVINMQLAAASHYPRSHGTRFRREPGVRCGGLRVDWHGAAFKTGIHEVSGDIELIRPATLHLCMPRNATGHPNERDTWMQERLQVGTA